MAGRVVFVRHGESIWNVTDPSRGLVTRFTGWSDVTLTDHGRLQAAAAGRCLKMFGIFPDAAYTSLLRRSRDSLTEMAKAVSGNIFEIPIISTWRLNERHYGALMGLSKAEAAHKLGHELVMGWRRSWDLKPPAMSRADQYYWREAPWAQPMTIITEPGRQNIITYEKNESMPLTESLEDCSQRVKAIWVNGIAPRVARGETVLVVAHANSIRSMIKHIDSNTMSVENVRDVNIPTSTPLVYSFAYKEPTVYMNDPTSSAVARGLKPIGEPSRLGMTGRYLASKEIIGLALKSSVSMEDETLKEGSTTFFDLIERGLHDILDYAEKHQNGKKEALVISDGRGVILHSNEAWRSLCGYTEDDVRNQTSRVLQGPLTCQDTVNELNEKLRTGLPASAKVINYRKNGTAFENVFTVIPVYDWLREEQEVTDNLGTTRERALRLDYSGSDVQDYRKYTEKFMHPSHFVARLDVTPDRHDLPTRESNYGKEEEERMIPAEEKKEEVAPSKVSSAFKESNRPQQSQMESEEEKESKYADNRA